MSQIQPAGPVPLWAKSPFELRVGNSSNLTEEDFKKALASGDLGFLHSYTTGSTVDGPGVRVVAWTSGCHWRCKYCHNPDTWTMSNGLPVTVDRAIDELRKYSFGLKVMSGGFTLSGGEPLLQDRFAVKLFAGAKKLGIHTALDTNGALGVRLSDEDIDNIDMVLLDIKTWDPERHRKLTGMEVGPTLEFARRLAELRTPISLRFVLVPGLTDNADDIAHIAEFAAGLDNVERVDVLPFHQMGRYKWKQLKIDYLLETVEPPSAELVESTCEIFRAQGLTAY
jgi:pyruvate formate lyase activating enzyme